MTVAVAAGGFEHISEVVHEPTVRDLAGAEVMLGELLAAKQAVALQPWKG